MLKLLLETHARKKLKQQGLYELAKWVSKPNGISLEEFNSIIQSYPLFDQDTNKYLSTNDNFEPFVKRQDSLKKLPNDCIIIPMIDNSFNELCEKKAKERIAARNPDQRHNSIKKTLGEFQACYAELSAWYFWYRHIPGAKRAYGHNHHDTILPEGWNPRLPNLFGTSDNKSKKHNVDWLSMSLHEATVAQSGDLGGIGHQQKCDFYEFSRIIYLNGELNSPTHVVMIGGLEKTKYFEEGFTIRKKGDLDYTNNNVCSQNCYNRFYSNLYLWKDTDLPKEGLSVIQTMRAKAKEINWPKIEIYE